MPPFWLNIRKSDVQNKLLQDVVRMKVVTHCNAGKASSMYVLKEYLAYKIYTILSPYSFRVRLVKMVYVDTGRKNRRTENWAFIIEPESMMVKRNGGFIIKNDMLSMRHMIPEHMDRVAMFQYMIGNADYSIAGRQNIKIMGLEERIPEGFIPVPYDFDYSGIVDAYYAIPGENLGIESVRERYFLGACRTEADHEKTIEYLLDYRDEMYAYIGSFPYLEENRKNELVYYLEEFYKMTSGPGFISREIESTCR